MGLKTDLTYLRELADGSNDFVVEMIEMFLDQTPKYLSQIDLYLQENDWESIQGIAHTMKPSLSFMGIATLEPTVMSIEDNCRDQKDLETIPDLVQQLNQTCEASYKELQEELTKLK
ncbi:MAG: Hpt domain-containing protein [Deltaproteobacteria bacterium]|nr:Hpt domain-containing protein [Deltaproteobacteria bacterium]